MIMEGDSLHAKSLVLSDRFRIVTAEGNPVRPGFSFPVEC